MGPSENLLWSTPVPASPSSPSIWGNRIFLTTYAGDRLETWALDRGTGRKLWAAAAPAAGLEEFHGTEGSPAASTPATDGHHVDGPVWFKAQDINGNGKLEKEDWETIGNLMKRGENVLVAVRPGGVGDVTASHAAWKYTRGLPYVPCPLFYEGRVYLVKDGGMITSLDAKSGAPIYAQERLKDAAGGYYASPVAADGRLYVVSTSGKLTVVKAGGQTPEILHQADFGEKIAATPALVGQELYLRTPTKLMAFGEHAHAAP